MVMDLTDNCTEIRWQATHDSRLMIGNYIANGLKLKMYRRLTDTRLTHEL